MHNVVIAMALATEEGRIDQDLLAMFLGAGSVWVLWVLIGLSVIAVAVMIERIIFYTRTGRNKAQLDEALEALRRDGADAAKERLEGDSSLPAAVARACLDRLEDGPGSVEEIASSAANKARLRFERGLGFLGTLGNNAPFVGLFGTVLGIIRAFHDLSLNTAAGSEAVMAGIAEALVATGVGLMVALPAVAAYNGFSTYVANAMAAGESAAHEILAHLKAEPAETGTTPGAA